MAHPTEGCEGAEAWRTWILLGVTLNNFRARRRHVHTFTLPCVCRARLPFTSIGLGTVTTQAILA